VKEQPILKRILLACSRGRSRLWRNNVGQFQDARGNWIRYGIANPGGSDLIGWNSVTITPDMVGRRVAIFAALEVKSKTGRIRAEQQAFVDNVKKSGGIAGVVRSVEEAKSLLT
jgi:hypothetical protein